jgi:hypothetical protein
MAVKVGQLVMGRAAEDNYLQVATMLTGSIAGFIASETALLCAIRRS